MRYLIIFLFFFCSSIYGQIVRGIDFHDSARDTIGAIISDSISTLELESGDMAASDVRDSVIAVMDDSSVSKLGQTISDAEADNDLTVSNYTLLTAVRDSVLDVLSDSSVSKLGQTIGDSEADNDLTLTNLSQVSDAEEAVEDFIGAGMSGNTETGIAVTYQDADGTFDFVAEVTQAEYDEISDDTTNYQTAYTHSQDNTQAHSDYMLNTGDVATGVYDFGGATSVEVPNGTNPTTDAAGEITVDTDDAAIEFYPAASRILSARHLQSKTITFPDTLQADHDDQPFAHFPVEVYPHGVTIFYLAISTEASCTDTHTIEEWDDAVGSSQSTVHSMVLSAASKVETSSPTDGSMATDSYLNINLDNSTDDLDWLMITYGFYVNPGD